MISTACNEKAAEAPKEAAKVAEAPKEAAKTEDAATACDVTVTPGAPADAVDVVVGKTFCVGEARLSRETKMEGAEKLLRDCRTGEVLAGETRLVCKGVQLSFGGPVLVLSRIQPTAS